MKTKLGGWVAACVVLALGIWQEGLAINANGELVDRWGTPYFFHQLSKDHMEIRSAGPDRQMGTLDDSVAN